MILPEPGLQLWVLGRDPADCSALYSCSSVVPSMVASTWAQRCGTSQTIAGRIVVSMLLPGSKHAQAYPGNLNPVGLPTKHDQSSRLLQSIEVLYGRRASGGSGDRLQGPDLCYRQECWAHGEPLTATCWVTITDAPYLIVALCCMCTAACPIAMCSLPCSTCNQLECLVSSVTSCGCSSAERQCHMQVPYTQAERSLSMFSRWIGTSGL